MSPTWFSRSPDTGDQEPWQGPRSFSDSLRRFLYRYRYVGTGLLLVALLLAVAWLVRTVIPKRYLAPVVVVNSAPYRWPFPPNAWAAEDMRDLSELDGETIAIESGSGPVRFAEDVRKIVTRDSPIIEEIVRSGRRPVVVYVSMHGLIEQDIPYLVPPRGQALNPATWVRLDDLISDCRSKYADTSLLFVLDCNRIRMNWHLGRPHNDFAKGLRTWWERGANAKYHSVAILCSADAGQRGWTSESLQGSIFGHYFRLGLAGAADLDPHGNRDGTVNLRELDSYARAQVSTWVRRHRADRQEPFLLVGGSVDDFEIAVTLKKDQLDRLISDEELAAATSVPEHDSLWFDLEKLRSSQPYSFEPLAWRELEHQLLWLQQLANSGSAYATLEQRTSSTLRARMDEIMSRKSTADLTRSILNGNSIISGRELGIPSDLDVRSLPLAEYLGTIEPQLLNSISSTLAQFDESPTDKMLHQTLLHLDRLGVRDLTQQHFLRMLDRYQFPGLWQQSARLHQLLALRQQAEQLAVPDVNTGDVRTHYWVRQLLVAADDTRRQAEDALFIEGQPAIEQHLTGAASEYQTALAEAQELSKAIRLRDRSWAEIPYLAQWLNDPLRNDHSEASWESDAQLTRDALIPLVNDTKTLDDLLDDHSTFDQGLASVSGAISRIKSQAQQVETELNQLHERLNSECKRLSDPDSVTTTDALDIRQIEAALRCPLVEPGLRSDLVSRASFLEAELTKAASMEQESTSEPANPTREWADRPGHDLLLSLLDLEPADSVATQWREGRTQLGDELRALSQRYEAMNLQDKLADREVRSEWVAIERRLRRVAPIWFPSRGSENPAMEVRRIDLRALVLWHGTRSLRDFWGPAGQTMEVRPFFDIATDAYLESSRRMLTTYGSQDIANLRTQLTASSRAALNWMSTSATESVRLDDADDVRTRITVQPDRPAPLLPAGAGAVLMRRSGRRVAEATFGPRASVPIPAGGKVEMILHRQSESQRLDAPDPSDAQLEAAFRGHEFVTPLRVDALGGITVAHRPYEYNRSRVTVHSPWTKLSVVFILDCSRSMETRVPLSRSRLVLARRILEEPNVDIGGGDGFTQEVLDDTLHDLYKTRLDVARGALQEMLANLEARRNVRVGLRFFGHRLGWTTDRPVRVLTSPTYPRDIPTGLTPDDDVERILPLGDLNSAIARQAYRELDAAAPWGQSPLHLSLRRTLNEDFAREDIDADQHVIVLTDGRDYQFRPTESSRATVDEIVELAQQRRVPIHVLGLDMNPDELRDALADFSSIASRTNGIFENLTSATDLIQALRDIFAPEMYQLADRNGQIIDEGPLGTPLYVSPDGVRPFSIRFREGEEGILLEGGEALSFFGRPRGSRLDFPRFDRDLVSATNLVSADRSTLPNHTVQFHKPVRTEHGVHFPVSIQRREGSWQWTRRPATAWIEITPVDSTWPTYIFYDANYEPDEPVPVLDLYARDWPAEASQASIRVWFTPQTPQPQAVASLTRIVNAAGDAEPIELENLERGVAIRLDARWVEDNRYRIRVVEVHDDLSDGVGSVKITPPMGDDVRPTEIVRQFDKQRRHVVHSFYYANPDNDRINRLARAEVGVIRREIAHRGAWQLPGEPVVVDITESGNFLPLETR